jgi:hypothetical protein
MVIGMPQVLWQKVLTQGITCLPAEVAATGSGISERELSKDLCRLLSRRPEILLGHLDERGWICCCKMPRDLCRLAR